MDTTASASVVFYVKATLLGSTASSSKKVVVMVCDNESINLATYFATIGTALWPYQRGETATISNFDDKIKSMFSIGPVNSAVPECNTNVVWSLWAD